MQAWKPSMRRMHVLPVTWPDSGRIRPDRGVYTDRPQALMVLQGLHEQRQRRTSVAPRAYVSCIQE